MCQDVSKISYFLLPNDARRNLWLINSGNENLVTTNNHRPRNKRFVYICEMHFEEKYLLRSGQRIQLTKSAVPKMFVGNSSNDEVTTQRLRSSTNANYCTKIDELLMAEEIVSTDEFLHAEEFLGAYGY